jgi:hypothetical protein
MSPPEPDRIAPSMPQVTERSQAPAQDELASKLAALAERRRDAIRRAFTRLHPLALGCGVGTVFGLEVLGGTLVLLLRGGQVAGDDLRTLRALSSYFPGFRADVPGALVGGAWAFAVGFVAGYAIAAFRNLALRIVLAYARFTAERWRRRHMLDEI